MFPPCSDVEGAMAATAASMTGLAILAKLRTLARLVRGLLEADESPFAETLLRRELAVWSGLTRELAFVTNPSMVLRTSINP